MSAVAAMPVPVTPAPCPRHTDPSIPPLTSTTLGSDGKWAEDNNFHFSVLVWRKPLSVINTNRFSQNVEFICRIYEYGTGLNFSNNKNDYDRVYNDKPIRGNQKLHPTQKPTSLLERLIKLSSDENDIVMD